MPAWTRLGDGLALRRDASSGTSSVAIVGPDGAVVVDAGGDLAEGERILADLDAEIGEPVRALVCTHAHWDHTFGAEAFVRRGAEIVAHANVAAHLTAHEAPRLAAWTADPSREPDHRWEGVRIVTPTREIRERVTLDLVGRPIELVPLRAGHTDGDLAVIVPDADLVAAGDVIEESGAPMFGSGVHPLGWPDEIEELAALTDGATRIVPGHGRVVDRAFVLRQAEALREAVAIAAEGWRDAAGLASRRRAHPLADPWPDDQLEYARDAL
jgi:glyoxylase-like metal-dependent hydrolase (beta-lactamase superfamily II)